MFSVILLPLTLITGFFGMNVDFPGFGTAWAFWAIFGFMLVALVEHVGVLPLQALPLRRTAQPSG